VHFPAPFASARPNLEAPVSEPFLIDTFDNGLVVVPLDEARRLAALNRALETCGTWGEFLRAVAADPATLGYLEQAYDGELPEPSEAFDADDVPGFADGDWPTWPKRGMLEWLPGSVQALGTIERTSMNGDFLQLEERLSDEVIEALAAEGIESYEDPDDLVTTASGAWRYG